MKLMLFLLLGFMSVYCTSNSILACVVLLVLIMSTYSVSIFSMTKALLAILCFLTYVSGLLIFFTYLVVLSSRYIKTKWSLVNLCVMVLLVILGLSYWFFNPSYMMDMNLFMSKFMKLEYLLSLFLILLVQIMVYLFIMNIKSLRVY